MKDKILHGKHIDVVMQEWPTLLGVKSVRLKCASKTCRRGCVMNFKTLAELSSVNGEELAGVLSLLCNVLAKAGAETAKRVGRKKVTSSVGD